jgi:hypothetical protein
VWTVDQLRLTLPAGFEHRAEHIARRVAEELAFLPATRDVSLRSLSVPAIEVGPGASDGEIAGRIARAISNAVNPAAGRPPLKP